MTVTTDTQTAEPVTAATEPAACEDETQSVYAWSNADDETEIITHRSWKLPLAATMLAAAGLAAGITMWPHHSTLRNPAAPPQAAPHSSIAPVFIDPDAKFINLYEQRGYREHEQGQSKSVIAVAHQVCLARESGEPVDQVIREVTAANVENTPDHPGMLPGQAKLLVNTAIDAMCPGS